MIKINKHFKKFGVDDENDRKEYEAIINNPLCTVTDKLVEKEKTQEYNDKGNLIRQQDVIYFLVHWEEKIL